MWLANALTLSRIPIAVVFWMTYGDRAWSIALVVLAALTDALDGTVARWARRRTAGTSTVGEWLDPVCDKFFVITVLGAIQVHDPAPWSIVALIAARELVLIPLAAVYRLMIPGRPHAYKAGALGKAATIAELAALVALVLHAPALPLAIAAAVLGLGAVGTYIVRASRSLAAV